MTFSIPTSDGAGLGGLTPMGPASSVMPVAETYVGPYLVRELPNGTRVSGTVGYTEAAGGDVAFGLGAAVPLTANTDIFFDGKSGGADAWAMMIGVEFKGGRADTRWY